MAIYMLKLFDHPELATAMRKAKRKHIEANYNLDKHTENYSRCCNPYYLIIKFYYGFNKTFY